MKDKKKEKKKLKQKTEKLRLLLPPPVSMPVTASPLEKESQSKEVFITSKQETETMEVHHHGHVHEKKKWLEYLFQFFMLFLAVTAGFFVENQREHYVEHSREKQFARQLLSDLRQDSSFFETRWKNLESLPAKHEKIFKLLTQPTPVSDAEVMNAFLPLTYIYDVQVITATYDQMKTSGSLRYIRDTALLNRLQQYYEVRLPRTKLGAAYAGRFFETYVTPYIIKHFRVQDYDYYNDSLFTQQPVIMDRTAKTDQELANIMENYGFSHKQQLYRMMQPAREEIKNLISRIKEEYDLK